MHPRVRVRGHEALITLAVPSAGRLVASGPDVRSVHARVRKARALTITVPLSSRGLDALHSHKHLRVHVRLVFTSSRGGQNVSAVASAVFRR